ncbi:MAG: glycerol-3-phosphate dehydrogenase [Rhodobacteraceae bacterium]|nr:glycerol-3-phosphate dehydrogenase [Paracoccaceae bacterium]
MKPARSNPEILDLFIIGGGINGCGIARDAAGRGLSVALAEMNDLASATSSSSTKLFHGGLRYLEYFEFRLVREALKEREVLLAAVPHISWPMRFVLPYHRDMRFDAETPVSRLLSMFMPWMRGRRPAWLIRFGLVLYDTLGGRKILPGTSTVSLKGAALGAPLKDKFEKAYEYSDCWVQDARLVVLNARDAADRGAKIMTRTKVVSAERRDNLWHVSTQADDGGTCVHKARCLINAGGPWVSDVIGNKLGIKSDGRIRLVRGSHIVTKKLYDHDRCYFFQGTDGRIIFAIPYENDFTLIGTTDADHADVDTNPICSEAEADYLRNLGSEYFKRPIEKSDIVWTYSGVRPLYDDSASSATAATREYVLGLDENGPPLLNIFGGKITTYRKLAEAAIAKLASHFPDLPGNWTAGVALPGGDFPVDGVDTLVAQLQAEYPFIENKWAKRLVRTYGTLSVEILGKAKSAADLGQHFGESLHAREVDWAIENEWVMSAQDMLWRRTKLGLIMSPGQAAEIEKYISDACANRVVNRDFLETENKR